MKNMRVPFHHLTCPPALRVNDHINMIFKRIEYTMTPRLF